MHSIRFFVLISALGIVSYTTDGASWKGGTGNWSSDNWYDWEPTVSDSAVIWNGTAEITENGEICKSLQLAGGASNFNGHVAISSGSLEVVNNLIVGPVGYGTVTMTGGLLKVNTIELSRDRYNPSYITISGDSEIQCKYFEVGWPGVGYVTQNGGTITTNELALTNYNDNSRGEGYYTLNAGTLNAGAVYVGIIKGQFKVTNPAATINITDGFDIRANGTLTIPADTTIHLKGAKFSCKKTVSSEIPDLANLTLRIEPRGGYESSLEAMGYDRGPNADVLVDNFSLDTIALEPGTTLRIISEVSNNPPDPVISDVAVAHQLNLGDESMLILGARKVYCQDWSNNCGTVDWRSGGCLYVLNASYDMAIGSSSSEISADGQSECEISAVLTDRDVPICNAYVRFNTDKGTLIADGTGNSVWAKTDAGGRATARLRSDTETGKATVTVNYMDYSKQVTVDFVKIKLTVTADPPVIPADGTSRSVIRATLEEKTIPVPDQSVLLQTQIGQFVTPGTGELVSSIALVTDADGKVIVEIQSDTEEGGGYVIATWQDQTDQVLLDFIGYELTLSAAPIEIACDGQSYSTLKALVTRAGQPIADKPVTFETTLGLLMPPGGSPGSQATVNTDSAGRAMLLLKSADEPGDATITATYEKLTRNATVSFRSDILSLSALPDTIADAPTSQSEITIVLMLDQAPAAGKSILVSSDKGHLYDSEGNPTNTAQTDSEGKATVVFKPDGDEGHAVISAEYSDTDVVLNGSCAVTIQPIYLTLKVLKVDYMKVPDLGLGQVKTSTLMDPDPVKVTAYGKSIVYIETQLEPAGIPEVAEQTILLESAQKDMIDDFAVLYLPEQVVTNEDGKAEFSVKVEELWNLAQWFDQIQVSAKWESYPDISSRVDIELVNNFQRLIDIYEVSMETGIVLESEFWDYLRNFRGDPSDPVGARTYEWIAQNIDYLGGLLLNNGLAGSVNNFLEPKLTNLPNGWSTRLGATACGSYQGALLRLFNMIRMNTTGSGVTDWLLNGIDYGPIHILGGMHVAVMIYPRGPSWLTDWRSDNTRVLDPWPTQNPVGAVYTWQQWRNYCGFSLFHLLLANEDLLQLQMVPYTNLNPELNKMYPANGMPYPDGVGPTAVTAAATNLLIDCPVYLTIEDMEGRRSGIVPDVEPGKNKLIADIPGVLFASFLLSDGSMGWNVGLPDSDLKVTIHGYENGNFTALLIDPQGNINTYSDADIEKDQGTEFTYDPNAITVPTILYPDGSQILPDGVIEIESWKYDRNQHRSKGTLTITNLTATAVQGPLRLAVESTSPDTITLVDPEGIDDGKPYLDLTALLGDGKLDSGESISRTIEFANPNRENFDLSIKLTGRTEEDKSVTTRRKFTQVGIPECSRDGLLPFDLAEGNAADWETWAESMDTENTYVFNDLDTKASGNASIMCLTDAPFDMFIRYGKTLTEPWDLSTATNLFIRLYARNDNFSFQNGSPWIRLKTDDDNYFEFQYFVDGNPYDLLNDCLWQWRSQLISLDAPDNEETGWRRTTVGSPDWTQICYLEIHADTWDAGFQMGVDGVGFDTDRAIYRDFNADCSVDALDLATLAQFWLCPECTPMTCEGVDIDLSGKVDLADFALFAEEWLKE